MNSRDAQDVILRLLADGPFRARALGGEARDPDLAAVLARTDREGLERFGRFLCRHYYRERIVHYFKYSRALEPLTRRKPEAVLKTAAFDALMPRLVLGERSSAESVLEVLRRRLTEDADAIRAQLPYWDELVAYQSVFFLSDALPSEPSSASRRFPARAEAATILELTWDLPAILPQLLRPFREPARPAGGLPLPPAKATRLLFARSSRGEVTVLRCTDALKELLGKLTGEADPTQVAAQMGLDQSSFERTLERLEAMGAVVAQESFSASHVGSDLPSAAATQTR
jgi:DNA-binding transcriptional ArsR family regulator